MSNYKDRHTNDISNKYFAFNYFRIIRLGNIVSDNDLRQQNNR